MPNEDYATSAILRVLTEMTRDRILFLLIGALAVPVAVLGYQLYQDRKKTTSIDIGERGISIEKK